MFKSSTVMEVFSPILAQRMQFAVCSEDSRAVNAACALNTLCASGDTLRAENRI
jgi:hypothetical protein